MTVLFCKATLHHSETFQGISGISLINLKTMKGCQVWSIQVWSFGGSNRFPPALDFHAHELRILLIMQALGKIFWNLLNSLKN